MSGEDGGSNRINLRDVHDTIRGPSLTSVYLGSLIDLNGAMVVAWFVSNHGWVSRHWILPGKVSDIEDTRTRCLIYPCMSTCGEVMSLSTRNIVDQENIPKRAKGLAVPPRRTSDVLQLSALSSSSVYKSTSGWIVVDTDLTATIMSVNFHVLVDLCAQCRE